MKLQLDIDNIKATYGDDITEQIIGNKEVINDNVCYLYSKGITNAGSILDAYPLIFMREEESFKKDVDGLISSLGYNYIELLEENLDLFGNLF